MPSGSRSCHGRITRRSPITRGGRLEKRDGFSLFWGKEPHISLAPQRRGRGSRVLRLLRREPVEVRVDVAHRRLQRRDHLLAVAIACGGTGDAQARASAESLSLDHSQKPTEFQDRGGARGRGADAPSSARISDDLRPCRITAPLRSPAVERTEWSDSRAQGNHVQEKKAQTRRRGARAAR